MSQDYWDSPEHPALYEIPIETLGLSDEAIKVVKRTGITTVGDCIKFLALDSFSLLTIAPPFHQIMYTEVLPKLYELGYLPPSEAILPKNQFLLPIASREHEGITTRFVLLYLNTDGYWSAEVPSLPDCHTFGETRAEALEKIRGAIEVYIEALQ
jgi:predicted RNase H-like HicB family nuclease